MLKWIGAILGAMAVVWMILQRDMISFSSFTAGVALGSSLFVVLTSSKAEKPLQVPSEEKLQWQMKLEESESKSAQTIDSLSRELQKVQQKAIRSEERCISYQKLVEVHQQEIEKLRNDTQTVAQELIQKERKLNSLYLAKMEPDLFDNDRHQVESINRELKKQLKNTQNELKKKESRDLLS